jgi:hypothetical protein
MDRKVSHALLTKALILRGLLKGLDDLVLEGRQAETACAMIQAGLPIIEQLAGDLSAISDQIKSEG